MYKTSFNFESDSSLRAHYLAQLHTLSSIPPNTDVHEDRTGCFTVTAPAAAWIPGIQSLTNAYKGHTPEKTADSIRTFANQLIELLNTKVEQAKSGDKKRIFHQLVHLNKSICAAIEGTQKGGGLKGLAATYEHNEQVYASLTSSIEEMQRKAIESLQALNRQFDKPLAEEELSCNPSGSERKTSLLYCPEEQYTDDDWEEAIAQSKALKPESVHGQKYYLQYSAALAFNESKTLSDGWNWWDPIREFRSNEEKPATLYLGALPMVRGALGYTLSNHLEDMQKEGIEAILSVVEVFENNSDGYVTSPIKPSQWEQAGIKQLQLPSSDFETMSIELIQRGVEYIHWNITQGRSTYVHCKAGRGRSALIVMCYLIKYHAMSAEEAFALVREQRKQAGFQESDPKMATLKEFEAHFKKVDEGTETSKIEDNWVLLDEPGH